MVRKYLEIRIKECELAALDATPVKENLIDIVENIMSGHFYFVFSLFKVDN